MKNLFIALLVAATTLSALCLAPQLAAGQARPAQAAPDWARTPDGKPNVSGTWAGPGFKHTEGAKYSDLPDPSRYTFNTKDLPFRPGGEEQWNLKLNGDVIHDDPTFVCLPLGFPYIGLAGRAQQFFQTPGFLVIVYEDQHWVRIIHMDGRPHPPDDYMESTWMGNSVGHYEGDTAVIDTTSLKAWNSDARMHMHSDAAHYIEKFRRTGPTTMSYEITTDDPKIFTKPWSQSWEMHLHPEWEILEDVCEENNKDPGLIEYLNKK